MNFARAEKRCAVYGISDGPQNLECKFPKRLVSLKCKDGKYFLNEFPVHSAFHLEVEEGSNPLVFKATSSTLTVTNVGKNVFSANFAINKLDVEGTCR